MELEFSRRLRKNPQILDFIKIRCVGAELMPCEKTDGRTDMTKLTFAFCKARSKCVHFNSLVNVPALRIPFFWGGGDLH